MGTKVFYWSRDAVGQAGVDGRGEGGTWKAAEGGVGVSGE